MTDDLLHLWLGMFPNLSNHVLGKIVDFYGGAEGLWNAGEDELRAHLTEKQSGMILQSRDEKKIIAYKNRLKERDITYIYPGHKYFPAMLADIPDCPNLLYAKGRVEELNSGRVGIAMVGARKASVYGMETADLFASELSGYNTVIISGLASGIDSRAQQAAVDSPSGFTIAVLGCGINICYPRENYPLFEKNREARRYFIGIRIGCFTGGMALSTKKSDYQRTCKGRACRRGNGKKRFSDYRRPGVGAGQGNLCHPGQNRGQKQSGLQQSDKTGSSISDISAGYRK